MTTIIPATSPQNHTEQEVIEVKTSEPWVSHYSRGNLTAEWAAHAGAALINNDSMTLSIRLSATDAASLALDLLRAADTGGFDVHEQVRAAAEELTDAETLFAEIRDAAEFDQKIALVTEHTDLTTDEAVEAVADGEVRADAARRPRLTWDELIATVGGRP